MKAIILFFVCLFLLEVAGNAQTVTSGPNAGLTVDQVIGYRVAGLEKMAQEAQVKAGQAKADLISSQAELAQVQKQADDLKAWGIDQQTARFAAEKIAAEKTLEAHNNAKQRDVLIYVFALSIALYALQASSSLIPPESGWFAIAAKATVFCLAFAAAYAFGRFALAWLAGFIP